MGIYIYIHIYIYISNIFVYSTTMLDVPRYCDEHGQARKQLHHIAAHCNTFEHSATHAATHCNTPG